MEGVVSALKTEQRKGVNIRVIEFLDDGTIPNSRLPLVIYPAVLGQHTGGNPRAIEQMYRDNGWGNSWRNGVYAYHHYHSVAHEALACYAGTARILFGGEEGTVVTIREGDAVVIPAGVSHRNMGSSDNFAVVGAYPGGQTWDMNYGHATERERALKNINKTPLPNADPFFGKSGPLLDYWSKEDL